MSKTKYKFSIPKSNIEVIGDKAELQQVFFNIIENAITHSQSKRPVQIKLMKKQKKVMFIVQDFELEFQSKYSNAYQNRIDSVRSCGQVTQVLVYRLLNTFLIGIMLN